MKALVTRGELSRSVLRVQRPGVSPGSVSEPLGLSPSRVTATWRTGRQCLADFRARGVRAGGERVPSRHQTVVRCPTGSRSRG